MRYLPLLLTISLIAGNSTAETHIPAGPVSGTWTLAGSPYLIEGEIGIRPGTLLTIEPGVEVIFQRHFKFRVYGQLLAVGTETDSITFTAADTTFGWHGLRFCDLTTQPDSSKLVYCKISYGRSSSDNNAGEDKHGGVIYCSNSDKLLISHCLIWNNRTGDVVGQEGFEGSGGTIYGWPGASGFEAASGHGGAIYLMYSSISVLYNTIQQNQTGNATGGKGGDGEDGLGENQPLVTGGQGGSGGNGVSGNGGALYCLGSNPVVFSNKFFKNNCGIGRGGKGGYGGEAHNVGWWSEVADGGEGGFGAEGYGGTGGALYFKESEVFLLNNILSDNRSGDGIGGRGGTGGNATSFGSWYGVAYGGWGGNGGNGVGGDAGALYLDSSTLHFYNNTVNCTDCGDGFYGNGGWAGYGATSSGIPGVNGIAMQGRNTVHINSTSYAFITNSILWENQEPVLSGLVDVSFSCIEGGFQGVGNINSDPLFIGEYFLSQIAAGQTVQSPCVDSGDPSSFSIIGTTRTDSLPDIGIIDMGFHHLATLDMPILSLSQGNLFFTALSYNPNPEHQIIQINNGYTGSFYFEINEDADWLTVLPESGGPVPPSVSTTFHVDITGLAASRYSCEVIVSSEEALGSPDTVYVDLFLGAPALSIEEDTLVYYAFFGFGNPDSKIILISNDGQGTFNYTIDEQIPWLNVSPGYGGPVPPTSIETVSADVSGLAIGSYEDEFYIITDYIPSEPDTIHVILNVTDYVPISGALCGILGGATTYVVRNDISVEPEDSLWIEPGACFMFDGNYNFNINGYLQAVGVEEDSIIFMPYEEIEANFSIIFHDSSNDISYLEYCTITGSDTCGLSINSSNPNIMNCTISANSSGGVRCVQASPNIIECNIFGNCHEGAFGDGGGMLIEDGSSPYISYCNIASNSAEGKGGGLAIKDFSTALIEHCTVVYNLSNALGGGIYLEDNSNAIFNNCTVSDNNALMNGGGIYIWDSDPTVKSAIISRNINKGIYFNSTASGTLMYNDFFDNEGGNITGNVPPDIGILTTTNINGDSCDIFYNIFEDPLFVDPTGGNFNLQQGSPCIDAGDPDSPLDPDSTIADIGAFYFDQSGTGIAKVDEQILPETFSLSPPFPNPFNPQTTIRFGLPVASQVNLTIYNLAGRKVATIVDGFRVAGYHEVIFNATQLSSGLYFYRIQAGNFTDVKKMILVK
ncbi:hypothetical protein CEE37_01780 [candidate division LCP-89 bacterium B3_LCP]|uniref:Secretion system C-terminal sorting domain-containing protein n=1 Tax=candidate division LCP-89 bacterium B3_LCP TaxID=2012998 RepID=A0A532V5F4_UNCL8|nr:MAG: hypothetical protein CEE37_01780 [candidate division LCP-89 bacterium B3_LCP]